MPITGYLQVHLRKLYRQNDNTGFDSCILPWIMIIDDADEVIRPHLPEIVNTIAFYSSITASTIIFVSIFLHLLNYRKPLEQRLMIRIHLIVPLFALSCYSMLINQTSPFNKFVLEPIREVYEAFVIYTFFSLLTGMLGGERNIIIMTSGRVPVNHPGLLAHILPPMDISDPYCFLNIKRGILQYVWLKPIICLSIIVCELCGWYNVNDMSYKSIYLWLTLFYNASVTLSLYCLAAFWRILWNDLKPFKPVGKFLCVKLIIFASYWQGIIIGILNAFGVLPGSGDNDLNFSIGLCIQNALLCVELIAFAIGHWLSFSYSAFTIDKLPYGRLQFKYAFKDMIGFKDLLHDFQLTFYGDYYKDYKQFDSVEAMIAHPDSKGRISRINQGLRYHHDGKQKHWLPSIQQPPPSPNSEQIHSTSEIRAISNYEPSVKSIGTSVRGLYPSSIMEQTISQPNSPDLQSTEFSITEILRQVDPSIDYLIEELDEDEMFYRQASEVINNYNLDQTEIKRLLNYPIVDDMIDAHAYGYRVTKLRQDRLRNSREEGRPMLNETGLYGSIA